eukprot:271106_1
MGIRGLYILHHEGKYYRVYNHNNSYYHGLGKKLLVELNNTYHKDKKLTKWTSKIKELQSVIVKKNIDHTLHAELVEKWNLHKLKRARDNGGILLEGPYYRNKLEFHINPSDEEVKRLRKYTDLTNAQHDKEWYCLLKKCQGSFEKVLDAGYILYEIESSLKKIMKQAVQGCYIDIEYFYILDLDGSEFRYMSPQHDIIKFNNYFNKQYSKWNRIKLSNINNTSKWPSLTKSPNECIEEATKYQKYGKELFKLNKYMEAIKAYKISLKWIYKIEKWIEIKEMDRKWDSTKPITQLYTVGNFKLANIYFKLNNWKYSARHCSAVLKIDNKNLNALIIRSHCRMQQYLFEFAKNDLFEAMVIDRYNRKSDTIEELMQMINNRSKNGNGESKKNKLKKCNWCGVKGKKKMIIVKDKRTYCVGWSSDIAEYSKPLRRCSVCCDVLYCSRKCQKLHWKKKHRYVCAKI